jgi:hypothetical protein
MTFNQWWGSLKWSYAARIFMEPIGRLFAEMAWNAAVRAEREACAKVCDELHYAADAYGAQCAAAIRARGNT